ncbi:hypothetical protein CKG00_04655 [Morganella morganii]|uniref:Beta/gamma crystallin 'Greek key' domain-containing protein n=1 Tax=Morganella morganii TaxID=582 RepID=A0A433ZUN0_MORMO|nr:hypothetical protein [Morganella morganii]RUT65772.1 hypothetical protein CKG00_04655 [Morganella morganii]
MNSETIFICRLSPFSDMYVEAGITEVLARKNASHRCQLTQGDGSIFCKEADAKCSVSKLITRENDLRRAVIIYAENWQRGNYLEISEDIPDLYRSDFNGTLSSVIIPPGWQVRFYEGENFTGESHTETSGKKNALNYGKKIRSVQIIAGR